MKKIIALASVAALAVPFVSSAAAYHYIDIYGRVNTIDAATPQLALQAVTTSDETLHSGVKLDLGTLETNEVYGQTYTYVSTTGQLRSVTAATIDAAALIAVDRAPGSGFMVME